MDDPNGSLTPRPPHLEVRGVSKRFGGAVALRAVDAAVQAGTVHALVGENGAGKSTLGKIMAGSLSPDEGTVSVNGRPAELRSPRRALEMGITMVAQELSLVPQRTVLDNVFLGMESGRGPFIASGRDRDRLARLTEEYGIEVHPDLPVSRLSVADQQKVEILRSLARNAKLIVMDEPTARLSSTEARGLRETVRRLADGGVTVVYVSHFLEEVLAIADRVTIMRDGAVVRTSPAAQETRDSLIEGIVGRSLDAVFPPRRLPPEQAPPVLAVENLGREGAFAEVGFQVKEGEIVVLAGLVGSGRSELARVIFGADRATSGRMTLDGRPYAPASPRQAIRAGVAMVPESRSAQGLLSRMTVRANMTLAHLSRFVTPGGLIRPAPERAAAGEAARTVRLTGATIESAAAQLSGGNQQKALFGRWLVSRPRLFIADEPTRGVDVGAKRGIYDLLAGLAADGMAVLLVSSEIEEVLGLAHRVLVMRNGRLAGEEPGGAATESSVMALAFGGAQ